MNINISAWSIRKPVPALMLFFVLTVLGIRSYQSISVQDFPDIELPVITVSVALPGAGPAQMETEITRKVEDAVASLGSISTITSSVTEGASTTSVEFELEKNTQEALDEVRDAVSRVRSQLPADVLDPQIAKVKVGGLALLTYSVSAPQLSVEELSWFVDNTVAKQLLPTQDVARVTRQGGVNREIQVNLDSVKLKSMGLTAADVSRQLKAQQQDAPSGETKLGSDTQNLRVAGTVTDLAGLRTLELATGDGRRVRLSDIAELSDTHETSTQAALLNGAPVVSFQVFRAQGASDVSVSQATQVAVQQLQQAHPEVKLDLVVNNVKRIEKSFKDSMHSLLEGCILAVIVVFLFLRDTRATLVSAVALPLSIIPTFWVMEQWFGFSLNTVTLLAITLVVGILVDDAIVEVENIVRHLRMGKSPVQAATDAAQEIGLAVMATTLTLVAVFLPTAFMSGVSGKFFKQFGWTASIAVMASLVVARLLTPMMAAYFLRPDGAEKPPGRIMLRYLAAVRTCLDNPWKTLGAAVTFFVLSVGVITRIPTEFLPISDEGKIVVNVELPPGSSLGKTLKVSEQARTLMADIPEILTVYTAAGTGAPAGSPGGSSSAAAANKATLTLVIGPKEDRKASQAKVEEAVRARLADVPGARFTLGVGRSGEKLSITLAGENPVALAASARRVEDAMREAPGLGSVSSSASLLQPEVVATPRQAALAQAGLTTQAVAQALRISTAGDYSTGLSKLNLPERQLPIRVQVDEHVKQSLDELSRIRIPTRTGYVELKDVADLALSSAPSQISRYNRERNVSVSVELNGQPLGDVAKALATTPALQQLPAGVTVLESGDLKRMKELFGSFGLAMAAGVACVYLVLVLLFHRFSQPLTILTALPLSAGGAFGLLALCGYSMSMPVLIGLLMLMGVVTKNSILLVEYAIVAQAEHGLSRVDALLDACAKRAQPIVMTTVAMAAGMLPLALGMNGDTFRAPMATAVIGGLLTSTLLSLVVVPVVYEVIDNASKRVKRLLRLAPKQS